MGVGGLFTVPVDTHAASLRLQGDRGHSIGRGHGHEPGYIPLKLSKPGLVTSTSSRPSYIPALGAAMRAPL